MRKESWIDKYYDIQCLGQNTDFGSRMSRCDFNMIEMKPYQKIINRLFRHLDGRWRQTAKLVQTKILTVKVFYLYDLSQTPRTLQSRANNIVWWFARDWLQVKNRPPNVTDTGQRVYIVLDFANTCLKYPKIINMPCSKRQIL